MLHLVDRSRLADDRLVRACVEADLDEIANHPRLYRSASDVNNVGQMLLNLVIAFWPQDEVERSAQTHDRQVACINELLADDTISRPERLREADCAEESHRVMHACALACAPALVSYLHSQGAEINIVNRRRRTPLHYAVEYGNYEVCQP